MANAIILMIILNIIFFYLLCSLKSSPGLSSSFGNNNKCSFRDSFNINSYSSSEFNF